MYDTIWIKSNSFINNIYPLPIILYVGGVGVKEKKQNWKKLECYPNPATNVINIKYELEKNDEAIIKIYDIAGREVFRKKTKKEGKNLEKLDGKKLKQGIYFIYIEYKTGKKLKNKITIIH